MLKRFLVFIFLAKFLILFPAFAVEHTVTKETGDDSGSLNQIIMSANSSQESEHVIKFANNVRHVRLTGEITITSNLKIEGAGVTIEGSGNARLFRITQGKAVFDRLTFTGGNSIDNGGAIALDGSNASVEFDNCTFFDNRSGGMGGAVCVTKGVSPIAATFKHCTIAGNYATQNGGGIAVRNDVVSLYLSIVTGNVSNDVYGESNGMFIGKYNIAGSINAENSPSRAWTYTEQDAASIFVTDSAGELQLETVDNTEVLRLSGGSQARDILSTQESYTLNIDQRGMERPKLNGYDAGAFEATPVPAVSIDIYGLPYIQINSSEQFNVDVYPEDASRNTQDYPDGIEWRVNNSSVISIDQHGNATAKSVGEALITAVFHGWDKEGKNNSVSSYALNVYTGKDPRGNLSAFIDEIKQIDLSANQRKTVTPVIAMSINEFEIENPKGGRNYELHAASSRPSIVEVDVISDDSLILIASGIPGSSDITVTATPIPDGNGHSRNFIVTVSDSGSGKGHSRSSGGGGCNAGIGLTGFALAFGFILKKGRKNYVERAK